MRLRIPVGGKRKPVCSTQKGRSISESAAEVR